MGHGLGVGSDGSGEGSALGSGVGVGGSSLLGESSHLVRGVLHGDLEVVLGNLGGGVDSVGHLLLELLAGLSVLGSELLDRLVGLGAEGRDLGLELVVGEPLHVLVHLVATLLDELSTGLTSLDGLVDGVLEFVEVVSLKSAEGSTTLLVLDGVVRDDTGEVLDLLVGLLVVLLHDLTEGVDLALELLLGLADLVHGIKAGTTGVGLKLGVLLGTHVGLLLESTPRLSGLLLELVLGVSAVLGELLADAGEGSVELKGHGVELVVGVLVVLGDGGSELSILLQVLLVALVAKLHHAGHLSVHVSVHLSLGGLVGADDASGLVNVVVDLHHLLLHLGAEGEEADLKAHGGLRDLGLSLGTGTGDVGNGLSVTLVLEGLLGVEGGLETHGGLTEGHVHLVTVAGHLGVHVSELSRGRGNKAGNLVGSVGTGGLVLVGELGGKTAVGGLLVLGEGVDSVGPLLLHTLEVLLGTLLVGDDLSGVSGNVLVHLVNLSVGGGSPRSSGLLPASGGEVQALGSTVAVPLDETHRLGVALEVALVAAVGQGSSASELALGAVHGTVEVIAGNLGVHRHLVEHLLLEGVAGSRVEGEVTGHLGTDRRDVGPAVGHLIADLLLNVVEVVHQAHAAIRGLSVDLASLEHISAANAGASIDTLHDLVHVLIAGIGGDVHHGAADGKAAQKRKSDARVGHLLLRRLGVHPFRWNVEEPPC